MRIKKADQIKKGDVIRIISMKDEPDYSGRTGIVTIIDDAGQIHGTWGGCALIPEVDCFRKIDVNSLFNATKRHIAE